MTRDQVQSIREELWDGGFRPVGIYNIDAQHPSPGKAPIGNDWQSLARQDPPASVQHVSSKALNTGVLCDGLRALDLDLEDATLVGRIRAMAMFDLGDAPMRVRDNSARCLLVYRAAEGEPPKRWIAGTAGKVEVLGRGQQFVAFGFHPSGAELRWMPEALNGLQRHLLPSVTEEQVGAFLRKVAPLIGATSEKSDNSVQREDSQEVRKLVADLKSSLAADVNVLLDLDEALVARFGQALEQLPRLRARWEGRTEDMDAAGRDTSRSGLDFSLAALLKGAHFTPHEAALLLLAFPFGAAFDDLKHPDAGIRLRYVARTAIRASVARTSLAPRPLSAAAAAAPAGGPAPDDDKPGPIGMDLVRRSAGLEPIRVVADAVDLIASAGEEALIASKIPVFRRDKSLVRPFAQNVPASAGRMTVAAGLDVVTPLAMVDMLTFAVAWEKWNAKEKQATPCDVPQKVAGVILSRGAMSKLPSIAGLITTPTLRPDGSVLLAPGYDAATRLYHVPDPHLRMPVIPARPTRHDADLAVETLSGLLSEFPFVADIDRAVALSAIITAVVRGALPVAPMHAFRASTAGTGKSYLADVVSMVATSRPCPVMAVAEKEEETEKRLVGLLLGGFPIINLDNVNGELGGDLLCQAIERPLIRARPLGSSDVIEMESRATLLATGNALRVRGDMTRRTLLCTLDAGMERPETREFSSDPVTDVAADRGKYVAACLVIVLAYLHSGERLDLPPVASFEAWNAWVRSALVWLGCGDPAASMETAREDDPELTELREVLGVWKEALGTGQGLTVQELDKRSAMHVQTAIGSSPDELQHPDLRAVLLKIAGERGAVNGRRLGKWLMARERRIADGMRLERMGRGHGGIVRWGVQSV